MRVQHPHRAGVKSVSSGGLQLVRMPPVTVTTNHRHPHTSFVHHSSHVPNSSLRSQSIELSSTQNVYHYQYPQHHQPQPHHRQHENRISWSPSCEANEYDDGHETMIDIMNEHAQNDEEDAATAAAIAKGVAPNINPAIKPTTLLPIQPIIPPSRLSMETPSLTPCAQYDRVASPSFTVSATRAPSLGVAVHIIPVPAMTSLDHQSLDSRSPAWWLTLQLYAAFVFVAAIGMSIYYFTERYQERYHALHKFGIFTYLFSGAAGNIIFALWVVPYIPADLWDALHSDTHQMNPHRRRWLRAWCYVFGVCAGALSMTLYSLTSEQTDVPWMLFYPWTYHAAGLCGNTFFYLWMLPHMPVNLRRVLHKEGGGDGSSHTSGSGESAAAKPDKITSLSLFLFLSAMAMSLYYLTETIHEIHFVGVFVYFCSGTAGNIFMAVFVVPWIPADLWEMMHSTEQRTGTAAYTWTQTLRYYLWCYGFALMTGAIGLVLYDYTADTQELPQMLFYPYSYFFSCTSANVFFYLWILPHFPKQLRNALGTLDERDAH